MLCVICIQHTVLTRELWEHGSLRTKALIQSVLNCSFLWLPGCLAHVASWLKTALSTQVGPSESHLSFRGKEQEGPPFFLAAVVWLVSVCLGAKAHGDNDCRYHGRP